MYFCNFCIYIVGEYQNYEGLVDILAGMFSEVFEHREKAIYSTKSILARQQDCFDIFRSS